MLCDRVKFTHTALWLSDLQACVTVLSFSFSVADGDLVCQEDSPCLHGAVCIDTNLQPCKSNVRVKPYFSVIQLSLANT